MEKPHDASVGGLCPICMLVQFLLEHHHLIVGFLGRAAGRRRCRLHPDVLVLEIAEEAGHDVLGLGEDSRVVCGAERLVVDVPAVELAAESVVFAGEQDERVPVLVDRLHRSELVVRHDHSEVEEPPAFSLEQLGVIGVLRVATRERVGDNGEVVAMDGVPEVLVVIQIGQVGQDVLVRPARERSQRQSRDAACNSSVERSHRCTFSVSEPPKVTITLDAERKIAYFL